jgi:tRNA-dihydrouridine synthase B
MTPEKFVKLLCEKKLLLPPISGYTDFPYRAILAHFQPPFIIAEMANARAIVQGNKKTSDILKIVEGPHYNGVQLVGSDPGSMTKAAQIVADLGFDYIDINMGCTARKVSCKGEGVSLMKDEDGACTLVSLISAAVDVPVTCKLRIGASPRSLNVLSLSQKLAKAGACAITIHGRSGEKKFGTPIDLGLIQDVTRALSVPVVANGGIFSGVDALHALQKTGAAAVMPGRGLIGNPWIIQEIIKAFSKDPFMPPSLKEKKDVCLEHLGLLCDFYGERTGVLRMRKILPEYFSSCEFLKELKQDVQRGNYACDIPPLLERIRELDGRVVYDTRTA